MPIASDPTLPNTGAAGVALGPLVVVVVYDGLGAFEFGIAAEVFGLSRPELGPTWYRFAVAAAEPGELRTIGGLRLQVNGGLELIDVADTVVIPAWRGTASTVPIALVDALHRAAARGARLVSICTGAFVLAAAGVLDGKRATTHWRHTHALAASYPSIEVEDDMLYVDEGSVLTSAGSAAGIDLCLHIVRRDFGPDITNQVARRLVAPPHREGGQAQFVERPVSTAREGARLGPLLDRLRTRLRDTHTIQSLADEARMSVRTFLRRFEAATGTTPTEWLATERLRRARELLEASDLPVETIAADCGFGSTATLRHHFRNRLMTSPSVYRKQFGCHRPQETRPT